MLSLDKRLIGIRIMQKRKEKGLSQENLSEKIGISKNHLSNIERGNNTPTLKLIIDICNILGETPDYYILGAISNSTHDIEQLVRRLPSAQQQMLLIFIKTYLDNIDKINDLI